MGCIAAMRIFLYAVPATSLGWACAMTVTVASQDREKGIVFLEQSRASSPATHVMIVGVGQFLSPAIRALTSPPLSALAVADWFLGRGSPGFTNPKRPLGSLVALSTFATAALMPSWASETTSFTPRMPRRASFRRNSVQNVSASDGPMSSPSTLGSSPRAGSLAGRRR